MGGLSDRHSAAPRQVHLPPRVSRRLLLGPASPDLTSCSVLWSVNDLEMMRILWLAVKKRINIFIVLFPLQAQNPHLSPQEHGHACLVSRRLQIFSSCPPSTLDAIVSPGKRTKGSNIMAHNAVIV